MYVLGASRLLAHHFDGQGPHQPATVVIPLQQPGAAVVPPPLSLSFYLSSLPFLALPRIFSYFVCSSAVPRVRLTFRAR